MSLVIKNAEEIEPMTAEHPLPSPSRGMPGEHPLPSPSRGMPGEHPLPSPSRGMPPKAAAPPNLPRRKAWRSMLGRLATLIVLLLLVSGGVRAYQLSQRHESTEDASLEAHITQLAPRVGGQVARVLVEDNQRVSKGQLLVLIDPVDYQTKVDQARAAVLSARQRLRASRARAQVTEVTTEASLDGAQADLQMGYSAVDKARSAVETARGASDAAASRVTLARAQLGTAQQNWQQARSQARAASVEVTRTKQDLDRTKSLVAQEAIPDQDLDHAKASYESAVAQLAAAQDRVLAAQSQLAEGRASLAAAQQGLRQNQSQVLEAQAQMSVTQAQTGNYASRVASARSAPHQVRASKLDSETVDAEVKNAQAALRQAELNASYTSVVAPMDGRVSKRQVEVGDYVQAGQSVVTEVSNNKWVVANFKETQLTHMHVGQKATIWVDAYPGVAFPARVDSLQPGSGSRFALLPPENASGNWVKVVQRLPVKITFANDPNGSNYTLEPGMSVEAEVELQ